MWELVYTYTCTYEGLKLMAGITLSLFHLIHCGSVCLSITPELRQDKLSCKPDYSGTFLSPSEGRILGGPLCAPGIYMASRESDLWSSHLQGKHFLNCCEPGPDQQSVYLHFLHITTHVPAPLHPFPSDLHINLDPPLPLLQLTQPSLSPASSTHRSCCFYPGHTLGKPLASLYLPAWSQPLPSSAISHINSLVLWHT